MKKGVFIVRFDYDEKEKCLTAKGRQQLVRLIQGLQDAIPTLTKDRSLVLSPTADYFPRRLFGSAKAIADQLTVPLQEEQELNVRSVDCYNQATMDRVNKLITSQTADNLLIVGRELPVKKMVQSLTGNRFPGDQPLFELELNAGEAIMTDFEDWLKLF